jgi:hypothetical protein
VFAECGDKMLYTSGNKNAVGFGRNKSYCVANVVSPESRVIVNDKGLVLPDFHIAEANSFGVFFVDVGCSDKFEEDAAIRIQQQSFGVL